MQLLQLLPLLVERLQDGCQALHLETAERDPFFANLAMLHAAIVRGAMQSNAMPTQFAEQFESSDPVTLSHFAPSDLPNSLPGPVCEDTSEALDEALSTLTPGAGISLHAGKQAMVYSRLSRRLRETGQRSFGSYLQWLETHAGPGGEALKTRAAAFLAAGTYNPFIYFRF